MLIAWVYILTYLAACLDGPPLYPRFASAPSMSWIKHLYPFMIARPYTNQQAEKMRMTNKFRQQGSALIDGLMLLLIFAAVFAIWYWTSAWIDKSIVGTAVASETSAQARGLFGDKFGAINALFSGFAFAGIIFTVLLQSRELNQTRAAFLSQTEAANKQRFDSTFFQLLALHNDITAKLRVLQGDGRAAFKVHFERLLQSDPDFPAYRAFQKLQREELRLIRDEKKISDSLKSRLDAEDVSNIEVALNRGVAVCDNYLDQTIDMHESKIRAAYTKVAQADIDNFSHYFRNLYHILKFIKDSSLISNDDRPHYSKIVRSQISEIELIALFYNSISDIRLPGREKMELGYPKMGKLLTHFDILQNMSPIGIIHPSHLQIFAKNNGVSNGRP